jgi:hypothetical protein
VSGKPLAVRKASTGAKVATSAPLAAATSVDAVANGRVYATIGVNHIGVFAGRLTNGIDLGLEHTLSWVSGECPASRFPIDQWWGG